MKLKIAVLPGDGIGPEVTNESIKVLNCIVRKFNHEVEMNEGLVGAIAIDHNNNPYPDETHKLCLESDAILFGAIGDPKYDNDPKAKIRPEQGLLEMRKKLGLYANLRPTIVFDSLLDMSPIKEERITGTDILFVRELTGGIYFGERGRKNNDNYAFDTCQYSRDEIVRIAKMGFEYAQKRSKKLCCVDKANILETSRLWRETVQAMEKDYPEVTVSYEFVDAVAMRLIQWPSSYDVLITSNLFGDILTDEASVISGSMGLMPSASVHYQHLPIKDRLSALQVKTLEKNCNEHDIEFWGLGHKKNGIVHVIGPENGITQPGLTIVCGDSHTSTHGAFGAIAFGIGTSEVEMVLACQSIMQQKPMKIL